MASYECYQVMLHGCYDEASTKDMVTRVCEKVQNHGWVRPSPEDHPLIFVNYAKDPTPPFQELVATVESIGPFNANTVQMMKCSCQRIYEVPKVRLEKAKAKGEECAACGSSMKNEVGYVGDKEGNVLCDHCVVETTLWFRTLQRVQIPQH